MAGATCFYRPRLALWLALSLFVPLTALVISTFVLDSAIIPGPAVFVAFPFIFLMYGMTVLKMTATVKISGSRKQSMRKVVPLWMPLVILPFWLSAMSGIFGVGNAADEKDGKYIVNDHGIERVVTKAEAIKGKRLELRLTSSIFAAFSSIGLVVSLTSREKTDYTR